MIYGARRINPLDPYYTVANAAAVRKLFADLEYANSRRPIGAPEFRSCSEVIKFILDQPFRGPWAHYRVHFKHPGTISRTAA
jgi:hypothetical protein